MSTSKRPAGTVVSDKGTQLVALPSKFDLNTRNGANYYMQDILSLPKPIQLNQAQPPTAQSVLSGDPSSPVYLSTGPHLTVIDHGQAVRLANAKPTKRRPKNSIRNNKSSFISRGIVSDQFSRRFKPDALSDCIVVSNIERSLVILDFGTDGNKIEPLAKLFFTKEWPLCHAFNPKTATSQQLDVIIGMSSGDLVWLDIPTQRYERVNKQYAVASAILALAWIPNTDTLVAAAHADGTLAIYDVAGDESTSIRATYSVGRRTTELTFLERSKLLIANHSDYLRILDLDSGMLREFVPSLFGCIFSVSLSPDGKYWASGGEDDCVGIYEVATRNLVVRLEGHRAWVNSISWDQVIIHEKDLDPHNRLRSQSPMSIYRLATLGEDREVMLWEFCPSMLVPPSSRHQDIAISPDQLRVSQVHAVGENGGPPIVYGVKLQFQTSTLSPIARTTPEVAEYGELQLSKLELTSTSLIIACREGRFLTWKKESQFL